MSEANVPDGWATRRSIALTALSAVAGGTALLRLLGEPDSARGEFGAGGGGSPTPPTGTPPGGGGGGGTQPPPTSDDGGLGDGDDDGGLPSAPAAAATVTVAPEDRQWGFMDPLVWVEGGGTVTWEVRDASHTVVAYHPDNERPPRVPAGSGAWNSATIGAEETYERTFDVPGVYDYFCARHEGDGAVGSVVVGTPSTEPGEQPGLSEPSDELPEQARKQLGLLNDLAREMLAKYGTTSG